LKSVWFRTLPRPQWNYGGVENSRAETTRKKKRGGEEKEREEALKPHTKVFWRGSKTHHTGKREKRNHSARGKTPF